MSNPTSNFGWQMPTATDLVTDLPADFEVFGQAVDSSLADLKGGTTGQILAKNTNADMDFVWVANDQGDITGVTAGTGLSGGGTSGAVTLSIDTATTVDLTTTQTLSNKTLTSPKISTLTTNGDLIYGTGSSVIQRLGIGTTGQVLSVSGGIPAWTTPSGATLNTSLITSGTITSGTSLTLSSLSNYDQLFLVMANLTTATAGSQLDMRINGVTTSVYASGQIENRLGGTNAGTGGTSAGDSRFLFGMNYGWKNNSQNGILFSLTNCKSASGFTNVSVNGTWEHFNTTDRIIYTANNVFASNATVSSISLFWEDGYAFTGGTYRLYGA